MALCKVLLYGLKPCDVLCSSRDTPASSFDVTRNSALKSKDNDYLNVEIKPLLTPTSSRASTSSGKTDHEAMPIRISIRENQRGRHRICVSQTLLRTHTADN